MITLAIIFLLIYICVGIKVYSSPSQLLAFDKISTLPLRGVLAIAVMLCHICPYMTKDYPFLNEFGLWGAIAIASFFFISGYGLVTSFRKKGEKYLYGFFHHRFTALFVPLIIITVLYQLILVIEGKFSLDNMITHLSHGYSLSPNSWYCYAIALFYFIFWITFKYIKSIRKAILANWIIAIVYIYVIHILKWGGHWSSSIFGLPMGMTWALYEIDVKKWIAKSPYKSYKYMICFLLIIFSYVITGFYFHTVPAWGKLISNITPPFIVYALMYVKIPQWKFLNWLGSISYEFYLLHGVFIYLFTQIFILNSSILLPVIFVCTIITSQGLMVISTNIQKNI